MHANPLVGKAGIQEKFYQKRISCPFHSSIKYEDSKYIDKDSSLRQRGSAGMT
jgi:hypothetical protein